jgi:general secretion pathway protein D
MAVKTFARGLPLWLALAAAPLAAQQAQVSTGPGGGVSINIVDTDVRAAVQSLARYLDRPVVYGQLAPVRVTLTSPRPVAPGDVLPLLRSMLEANGHEIVADGGVYRVQAKQAPQPAVPVPPSAYGGGAPAQTGGVQLFVIRLRHARAADVAATVNALYGKGGALGEIGERPQTLSDQLRQNRIPPPGASQPQSTGGGGGSGALTGELIMVPDERTNSLLVRATPGDFQLIQQAVQQVDVRPLQVLIEVVIAEVRRNSSLSLGLSSALDSTRLHGRGATLSAGNPGLGGLHGFVLRAMGVGGDVSVNLTLEAAASHGDATIVSRPVVLAANNENAEVLVGDQVPFVQLQRTLPTDNGVRDQIVQYKDVGTHLNVRPTISADGDVMLEVTQEINDVNAGTTLNGVDAPVISTRSLQTQLLVRDGQTAVLGGLARRRRDSTRGGVPYLSRIPVLGWIFGGTTRDADDTELFLFLTPRVIRDDTGMDATTSNVQRAAPAVTKAAGKVRSVVAPAAPKPPASTTQGPPAAPNPQ